MVDPLFNAHGSSNSPICFEPWSQLRLNSKILRMSDRTADDSYADTTRFSTYTTKSPITIIYTQISH